VRIGVAAGAAGAVAGRRQQAELLVVTERPRRDARSLGDLADAVLGFAHQAGTHSSTSGASSPEPISSSCTYLLPRIHDAAAATTDMIVAAENTMRRPCMNGLEISCGK